MEVGQIKKKKGKKKGIKKYTIKELTFYTAKVRFKNS